MTAVDVARADYLTQWVFQKNLSFSQLLDSRGVRYQT